MKTLLVAIFIACACNLSAQSLNFEKQKDLSVSVWNRDSQMARILWRMNDVKTEFAVACVGNNLTRFIIKQKGVAPIIEKIDHQELAEGGYLVLKFKNEVKKVKAYNASKEPFGFTVEITLK
jgi:hypothetical protein